MHGPGREHAPSGRGSGAIVIDNPVSTPTVDHDLKTIDEVYLAALGSRPFPYQRRIVDEGLPELLSAPTGCGKTPAMLLGWLYRKVLHEDATIRRVTPTRLIWCTPLRGLTEDTAKLAEEWVNNLELADRVDVHALMGGHTSGQESWRLNPDRPTVIVSTIDMALSRALNRGYGGSPYAWPIDFAFFNDNVHWVFDEIQLMDVALTTSRQLHGLRSALGVMSRHSTTWMSATVDRVVLATVDAPIIDESHTLRLSSTDLEDHELARKVYAPKQFKRVEVDNPKRWEEGLADIALKEHVEGSLTVVCVNTVQRARSVFLALQRAKKKSTAEPDLVLLHSRFRPGDRRKALEHVKSCAENHENAIVVSTQVIEAGIDLSAQTLISECAPWFSLVQRAGRCNRKGDMESARFIVVGTTSPAPYDPAEVAQGWDISGEFSDRTVTPNDLASVSVSTRPGPTATLRRKDLLDLFDTTPDISGNHIDVSRFIRDSDSMDIAVAWRDTNDPTKFKKRPLKIECCPAPPGEVRTWIQENAAKIWVIDSLESVRARNPGGEATEPGRANLGWRLARTSDIRPGACFLADCSAGGYSQVMGFDPKSKTPVEQLGAREDGARDPTPEDDVGANGDPLSTGFGRAIPLGDHLQDARKSAEGLCETLALDRTDRTRLAIVQAAYLHDVGKAHFAFQDAVNRLGSRTEDPDHDQNDASELFAKSGRDGRLRYEKGRAGFRHELASVSILEADGNRALVTSPLESVPGVGTADLDHFRDLVIYLVGAHHGRVRLSIRGLPHEDERQVLGLRQDDEIHGFAVDGITDLADAQVDLGFAFLGGDGCRPSWSARAESLLAEYGPFRLAWMEAMVRIADWRASRDEAQGEA